MKLWAAVLLGLVIIGVGSFLYFATGRRTATQAPVQQTQKELHVYQNDTHGFSLEYPPSVEVKEYGPDNISFGTSSGGSLNAVAEASVFSIEGKAGQTMEESVASYLMNLCAADGPMGSFACTSVSDQESFTTTSGINGFEIILWGEESNSGQETITEEKRGPFYVIPLTTSATASKVLVVYPPLNTSTENAPIETIEAIAKSAQTQDGSPTAGNSIESYIKENISELSPVSEQLGGTFYVTEIEAQNGTGVVWYEDGHNAYTADFSYEMTGTEPTVTSFTVREN